jgi:hypothetical protein
MRDLRNSARLSVQWVELNIWICSISVDDTMFNPTYNLCLGKLLSNLVLLTSQSLLATDYHTPFQAPIHEKRTHHGVALLVDGSFRQ